MDNTESVHKDREKLKRALEFLRCYVGEDSNINKRGQSKGVMLI